MSVLLMSMLGGMRVMKSFGCSYLIMVYMVGMLRYLGSTRSLNLLGPSSFNEMGSMVVGGPQVSMQCWSYGMSTCVCPRVVIWSVVSWMLASAVGWLGK